MTTNVLSELDVDATTAKRAQYEGFEFDVVAPGILKVTNGSYGDEKEEHTYKVNVENGVPTACECKSFEFRDGACKHMTAVAIREPVLNAACAGDGPQAVADGGIVVADDEGEVLESEDDGRPEDCDCAEFLADAGLPCWPCYREGFREPADTESEDDVDERGREEPTRSEPADFGHGESTGVQDL